jgi:prepilin peptidase CpaA
MVVGALIAGMRRRSLGPGVTQIAALVGVIVHGVMQHEHGVIVAVAGMVVAWTLLLPAWLGEWIGGDDLSLVAAVGAWLGMPLGPAAAIGSLVASALLALVTAARRGVMPASLFGAAALATWAARSRGRAAMPQPPASSVRLPFALAVLAGAGAAMWLVH